MLGRVIGIEPRIIYKPYTGYLGNLVEAYSGKRREPFGDPEQQYGNRAARIRVSAEAPTLVDRCAWDQGKR
jgi:hypothetical protein